MKRNMALAAAMFFAVISAIFSFPGEAFAAKEVSCYTIKWGDTLKAIAVKHYGKGMERKLFLIAKVNRIKYPDKIFAGDTIVIPQKSLVSKTAARKLVAAKKNLPQNKTPLTDSATTLTTTVGSEVKNKADMTMEHVSQQAVTSPVEVDAVATVPAPAEVSQPVEQPKEVAIQIPQETLVPTLPKENIGGECGEMIVLMNSPQRVTITVPKISCGKKKLLESIAREITNITVDDPI